MTSNDAARGRNPNPDTGDDHAARLATLADEALEAADRFTRRAQVADEPETLVAAAARALELYDRSLGLRDELLHPGSNPEQGR